MFTLSTTVEEVANRPVTFRRVADAGAARNRPAAVEVRPVDASLAFVIPAAVCEANGSQLWALVMDAAALVYGKDRKGRVAATNSMVHEVYDLVMSVSGA